MNEKNIDTEMLDHEMRNIIEEGGTAPQERRYVKRRTDGLASIRIMNCNVFAKDHDATCSS